jgi:hypothetical protein
MGISFVPEAMHSNRVRAMYLGLVLVVIQCTTGVSVLSQGAENYGSGLTIKLNESGSSSLRIITWHQIWAHYTEHNPGSYIEDKPVTSSFDVGIRRSRMLFLGKLGDNVQIVSHFGINNQTASTGGVGAPGRINDNPGEDGKKPQLFLHDAYVEYKFAGGNKPTEDQIWLGAGLHYNNGLSRLSMASTLNFMALDAPIYNWSTIEAGDQFARMLGIFIKGKVLGFDYTFSYDTPFRYGSASMFTSLSLDSASIAHAHKSSTSNYSSRSITPMLRGYAAYEFWDKESRIMPFTVGSYVGTKRVLNIGAGFQYQSEGVQTMTARTDENGRISARDTTSANIFNLAVDAFLDYPFSTEPNPSAITYYGVFYKFNFGENYIRNIGILNPATRAIAGRSFNGAGNALPLIGTGTMLYSEVGYVFQGVLNLIPNSALSRIRVQPYLALSRANYEALNDTYSISEVGTNFYLDGHNAKITFHYKTRPVFDITRTKVDTMSEFITQFMVYI